MKKPTVIAHRGLHQQHIENTLPALRAAWDAGFIWCEIDVRGSAEHEPFLMHDETLERTTAGRGAVAQTPAGELHRLGVPSFQEVVGSMPSPARLLVEIKPKVSHQAVDRVLELCNPSRCIVQSFDAEILLYAGQQRRDIELHLLVDDARAIEGGPWNAINAQFKTLNGQTITQIRAMGFGVGAWTPNELADMKRMAELGVDRIITDNPIVCRDNVM
jgi:glycerophosphoryl diester phosphodiesterase